MLAEALPSAPNSCCVAIYELWALTIQQHTSARPHSSLAEAWAGGSGDLGLFLTIRQEGPKLLFDVFVISQLSWNNYLFNEPRVLLRYLQACTALIMKVRKQACSTAVQQLRTLGFQQAHLGGLYTPTLTCCCHQSRQTPCQGNRCCVGEGLLHCCWQLLQVLLCDVAQGRAQGTIHTKAHLRASMNEAHHENPGALRTHAYSESIHVMFSIRWQQ